MYRTKHLNSACLIVGILIAAGSILWSGLPANASVEPEPLAQTSCVGNTCQTIVNSGLNVTDWSTGTTVPISMCTYARFYQNGTLIATSSSTCIPAGTSASSNWDPGSFPAGTSLCSSWSGVAGKPCTPI